MKPLLNNAERATHEKLEPVCRQHGCAVFCKVRIADVLEIQGSGISNDEYSYALKAHFDFIVVDKDNIPQFAVEFDGPTHQAPLQARNDAVKNGLCARLGLPLLRINARYLTDQFRSFDLLSYCIEVWFLAIAFDEAQAKGQIPPDEPFDPALIISADGKSERFPYWLSVEVPSALRKMFDSGLTVQPVPSSIVGVDATGNYRAIAWLQIRGDLGVIVESGMRCQQFPIDQADLLLELLTFDVHQTALKALNGHATLSAKSEAASRFTSFAKSFRIVAEVSYGKRPGQGEGAEDAT